MKETGDRSVRIIGGARKGKKLLSVPGHATRPLMRRVKQSLFDIIDRKVEGAAFLDLYAGIGSVGMEAISRGAARVAFVETDPGCIKVIKSNLSICRFADKAEVYRSDILLWLKKGTGMLPKSRFNLIFSGPPFKMNLTGVTLETISRLRLIEKEGWIICQHHVAEKVPQSYDEAPFINFRQERYGKTMLSFFRYE